MNYIVNRINLVFLVVSTVLSFAYLAKAEDYRLIEHSIKWTGSMPAKTHTGLISPKAFEVSIKEDGTIESLSISLEMDSIDVTDLKEGKMRNKLMEHLRSDDFFDVENYPTSGFVMSNFENGNIFGMIEIRGIKKEFSFPVEIEASIENGWILSGEFSFNRQDFNVKYQNRGFFGTAKDKLIRDEIYVNVSLKVGS